MSNELWRAYNQVNQDIRRDLEQLLNDYLELPYYQQIRTAHLIDLELQVREIINSRYSIETADNIANHIREFIINEDRDGYFSTFYQIESEIKRPLMVNRRYIRQSVINPVNSQLLSTRLYQYREQLAEKATDVIRSGVIQGIGFKKIAKQITRHTEATYKQALRIARTEGHRTRNQARQQSYKDAQALDINLKKMWVSALDTRTRDSHRGLDGQVVDIDDSFKSPSGNTALSPGNFGVASEDINCRCTMVTIVEDNLPKKRRDGDGQVIEYQNYYDWLKERTD